VGLLRAAVSLADGRTDRLLVAHFDHRLRPESSQDARFVAELCRSLGVACTVEAWVREGLEPPRSGLEPSARQARYRFLCQVAERAGARYVATAHTADDQAETILHRIVRGAGLRGLAGIRSQRPLSPAVSLVRPLLSFGRAELRDYLDGLGQRSCHDETNFDQRRTRNRLRHGLLPRLAAEYNPQVASALVRLGQRAAEAQDALDALAAGLLSSSGVQRDAWRVELDVSRWAGSPKTVCREALCRLWREHAWPERTMTAGHWNDLVDLATSKHARPLALPGRVRATREGSRLLLARNG
jgi:tRNA(Ile)-lysidine synthase